jgi:predicted enzyme related to lactoylglutathione lyase
MVRDRREAARMVAATRHRGGRVVNLNSVLIGSEDADRLADYYTKLFGEPDWHDGGFTGWRLGSGGLMVGPHDQVHGANREPGRLIFNIESADVSGDLARLRAAGATVIREPYRADEVESTETWIATLADPDGNYFQLVSPM